MRRWAVLVALVAVAVASGCAGDRSTGPAHAKVWRLVMVASYPSPNVTFVVNGQSAGTITSQYSGDMGCGPVFNAPPSEAPQYLAAVDDTYNVRAVFPDGRYYYWDPVRVTQAMADSTLCDVFRVPSSL